MQQFKFCIQTQLVIPGEGMIRILLKKYNANKCMQHEDAVLIDTGRCPGTLVYVYPSSDADYPRWLGFFSRNENNVHNHLCPRQNRAGSKLEEMIKNCIERIPQKQLQTSTKDMVSNACLQQLVFCDKCYRVHFMLTQIKCYSHKLAHFKVVHHFSNVYYRILIVWKCRMLFHHIFLFWGKFLP